MHCAVWNVIQHLIQLILFIISIRKIENSLKLNVFPGGKREAKLKWGRFPATKI